jgi:hypothetical protein
MAGPSTIPRGNILNSFILRLNITPVAVGANTLAEQNFTVPGLLTTDEIGGFQYITGAYAVNVTVANMRVSANNTLTIAYANATAGALTPPSGLYYLEVNRPENVPPPPVIS